MNKSMWGIALASSLLAGSMLVRADDTPTTKPAGIKIEKPYSEISDLTDDEKSKIHEIHEKALADMKAIREKQDEDIRAVLTDDQKAELDKIIAEHREKMEAREKEKHPKDATTEPAGG